MTLPSSTFVKSLGWPVAAVCACMLATARPDATASAEKAARTFDSPQAAVDALLDAADRYDVEALEAIFGPDGDAIIHSGEPARDKQRAAEFAAKAHEKKEVSTDPQAPNRALLVIGADEWPFPVPLVKSGTRWLFDTKAGLQEILYRRIGGNELDAIRICRGYVEAQNEYAAMKRGDNAVTEYAQRIISTPGKQDGLAWQNADGTWAGPIGERIAQILDQGYVKGNPYHGYFFKVLKGQGPAAPLGRMDYVVKGVMIGGFALAAAPAEYRVTGVKTFIVANDGVVYEKDLGPATRAEFDRMELFNPDPSWHPVDAAAADERTSS